MKAKNITELMQEITSNNGIIKTDMEYICYMQDCIGHSTIAENIEASNGTQKELFYRIYGIAYGTVEAIKFYCLNSEKVNEMRTRLADQEADLEYIKSEEARHKKLFDNKVEEVESLTIENASLNQSIKEYQEEIIRLKARIYDLIVNN